MLSCDVWFCLLIAAAELEKVYPAMMLRLREQVTQQLEDERWMYEPINHHHAAVL